MDYNDYSREELYRLFLKFAFELNETIIRNEDKKYKYQEIILKYYILKNISLKAKIKLYKLSKR